MQEVEYKTLCRTMATMLAMQHEANRIVHPQWWAQGYNYSRAVWAELAELIDHWGWKWWTKQESNIPQCRLELVDAWHSILSGFLRRRAMFEESGVDFDRLAERLAAPLSFEIEDRAKHGCGHLDLLSEVDGLASAYASLAQTGGDPDHPGQKETCLRLFARVMACLPMEWDELYAGYVGKNALNAYRQENGYREGAYVKVWGDGREDNEHLNEIVADLNPTAYEPDFRHRVLERLASAQAAAGGIGA